MKTKVRREEVATALAATLQPQIGATSQRRKPAKAIAATLDKLAQQLVTQQRQHEKNTRKEAAKAARQSMVEKLTKTLRPHLGTLTDAEDKTGKALTKTLTKLAEQLLTYQNKRNKAAKKPVVTVAANAVKSASPAKLPRRPTASRPTGTTASKNGTVPKRTVAETPPANAPAA